MIRIAIISECNPLERKGLFNAVHNRVIQLTATGECEVDVYCLQCKQPEWYRRKTHSFKHESFDEVIEVEGVSYNMLWYRFSLIDYLLSEKMKLAPFMYDFFLQKIQKRFVGYDVISAHSLRGAVIAKYLNKVLKIPYTVTWHGADIYTLNEEDPLKLNLTRDVMQSAANNIFVSGALMADSRRFSGDVPMSVVYNGVPDTFETRIDSEKLQLRDKFNLNHNTKVVAYIGNLHPEKNVEVLPELFHKIRQRYEGDLEFWIIGEGVQKDELHMTIMSDSTLDYIFWGDVSPEAMPEMYACLDLIVIPSFNEGLPIVCLEALKAGVNVVGSAAGGLPEVIGEDFTVPLIPVVQSRENFINAFAQKVTSLLETKQLQPLKSVFDWRVTAFREMEIYRKIVKPGF